MAEWVLKGSLKGPQGDPGQDAQLPAGGTEGQVLTKTASGEEWRSYLRVEDIDSSEYALRSVFFGADRNVPHITIVSNSGSGVIDLDTNASSPTIELTGSNEPQINIESIFGEYVRLSAKSDGYADISTNGRLTIGSKYVNSITDAIADSPAGRALTTDKAVKDYADSVGVPAGGTAGQVLTKTEDGEAWADANSSGISVVQAENKYGTRTLDKGMKLYGIVWIDDMDNTVLSGLYTESTLETIISSSINIGVGGSIVDISDNGNEFVVRSSSAVILDFYGIE